MVDTLLPVSDSMPCDFQGAIADATREHMTDLWCRYELRKTFRLPLRPSENSKL